MAHAGEDEEQGPSDADDGGGALPTEKDAAVQFAGDLKPWGTALGGRDEVLEQIVFKHM